jgi:hypothetical protein
MAQIVRLAGGTLHAGAMFLEHRVRGASCVPQRLDCRDVLVEAGKRVKQTLERLFPGCELGAEPPIGKLFGSRHFDLKALLDALERAWDLHGYPPSILRGEGTLYTTV